MPSSRTRNPPSDLRPERQRIRREQAVLAEPAVPEQGRVGGECEVEQGERRALKPPMRDRRKLPSGEKQLEQSEARKQAQRDIVVQTDHR